MVVFFFLLELVICSWISLEVCLALFQLKTPLDGFRNPLSMALEIIGFNISMNISMHYMYQLN